MSKNSSSSSSSSLVYQNILSTCVLHDEQTDETIDDEAPIVVEMNKQFGSPGSTVNLSGQDLSDWVSMQSLCARLSRSDNAKSIIYLDHCNLGRHGAAIVSRSFTHVLIRAGNYVAKWLPLMHQNGRIIVLSMINNDIGPDGAAAVAKMLRVNTGLRELNLRFNSLKSDGAQYLASALYVNNTLRFLCVSGNELCGLDGVNGHENIYDLTGISSLFRALHVNTRLKTLKIAENDIGNDGAKLLADALRENKSLSVLDIHGNSLFGVLEEDLLEDEDQYQNQINNNNNNNENNENINNNNNNENENNNTKNINSIEKYTPVMDGLDDQTSEQILRLTSSDNSNVELKYELNGLDGGGTLLRAIGESKYLTSVDISWNDMGPKAAILFAASLQNNSTLTYLDIHGNYLGDDGVSALCLYLKESTCNLNILCIQRVGMTAIGALIIAEVLSINTTLTKLNISHNMIETVGSQKIAFSLRSNTTLKDLNLRNCGLCSEGIAHIANMLQFNRTLIHLNLSSNNIEDDGAIAISATLSLNPTLETLDMSSYLPVSLSPTTDNDDTPLAISSHSKRNPTQLPPGSPSRIRSTHGINKYNKIGESGMESLAVAIKGNIRLSQLILNGHELSPKMCQDLLSAMDESRVCTIIADFKSFKWRYDEILLAMKAERELLSSCYTPKSLRIHLCGQTNSKKSQMLRGWYNNQQLQFWTGLFGTNIPTNDTYGLEILKLSVQNRIADMNFWCYDGTNQLHELHRLHLRSSPLSVAMIAVSSVGSAGQCRSAAQIAAEISSWIRLLMTFGHHPRDISIIITNGSLFDIAWHGVDPSCVGVPSLSDELNHSRSTADADPSTHSILSSPEKSDSTHLISNSQNNNNNNNNNTNNNNNINGSSHSSNLNDINQSNSSNSNNNNNNSAHSSDIQMIDESFRLMKSSSSPSKSINQSINNSNNTSSQQQQQQQQPPSEEQNQIKTTPSEIEIRRRFEESIHEHVSLTLGWKKTPQLFCWDEGENGSMPSKIDQWLSDRYKSQSHHVQVPNICSIIREQCLPELIESSQKVISLDKLLLKCKKTIKCLQLVELRQACQWLHLLGDIVILDTIELDSYEKDMWSYLRNYDFQTENSNEDIVEIPSHYTLQQQQNQQQQQQNQQNKTRNDDNLIINNNNNNNNNTSNNLDSKIKSREGKRLKIQNDLELMKKKAPQRNCKIILNPEWFTKHILTGMICKSDTLTKNQSMLQPWCDNEYIYTHQEIFDYLYSYQNELNMKIPELLISLELQRIGVILPSISSFCLPCRIMGDKMKWLSDRQVTKMSLSQFNGYGSRQNNEFHSVTSAIGRRIKTKHPYILPPSTFSCLQSHILHTWISEKDSTWKYYRIMLWERGIGITIEQPPVKSLLNKQSNQSMTESTINSSSSSSPSTLSSIPQSPLNSEKNKINENNDDNNNNNNNNNNELNENINEENNNFPVGSGSGFICVFIETTSKILQPDWTQNPESVIDIMIWGEGICDNTQFPLILAQFISLIYKSCQITCQGALRSEGESVEALMPPSTNWIKTYYLKPSCFLHTLLSNCSERNCGEYYDDYDCNEPLDSPILVNCHHIQPRLCKSHLLNGYILSSIPGQGKGVLRSIFTSLERSIESYNKESINNNSNNIGTNTMNNINNVNNNNNGTTIPIVGNIQGSNPNIGIVNNFEYSNYFTDLQSNIIASE